jgi:uncharacterized protein (DUF342 family)
MAADDRTQTAERVTDDRTPVPTGERITVALVPKVVAELQRLQERTSLSKTDLTNRAITLYEFIEGQTSAGREVLIRDPQTGETQLVRFL